MSRLDTRSIYTYNSNEWLKCQDFFKKKLKLFFKVSANKHL
jgi:hypothetical protein